MSELRMSYHQAQRIASGNVQRMTEEEVAEIWGSGDYGSIDVEELEVYLWRCVDAHDGLPLPIEGCPGPEGDCGCCCNVVVWESPANVPDWTPTCQGCLRPAMMSYYVGLWGELRYRESV